jgi:sulfatase maturation enzyme AslB (radical SAM superfamily)
LSEACWTEEYREIYERIVEISEWAIDLCDKLKKKFYANITTNGTLLTKERIEKLRQLGVVQDIFDTEAKATKCLECRYPKSKIFICCVGNI